MVQLKFNAESSTKSEFEMRSKKAEGVYIPDRHMPYPSGPSVCGSWNLFYDRQFFFWLFEISKVR